MRMLGGSETRTPGSRGMSAKRNICPGTAGPGRRRLGAGLCACRREAWSQTGPSGHGCHGASPGVRVLPWCRLPWGQVPHLASTP